MRKAALILIGISAFFAHSTFAAINLDANSTTDQNNSTVSWSHTGASTSTIGFVGCGVNNGGTDTVTSITWGGFSMTRSLAMPDPTGSGGGLNYIYYIASPPIGNQTITVSESVGHETRCIATTYTGSATVSPIDAVATSSQSSSGNDTVNITTSATNEEIFAFAGDYAGSITAGAGCGTITTLISQYIACDQVAATAGSYSVTISSGGRSNIGALAFFQAGGGGGGSSSTPSSTLNFASEQCVTNASGTQCYNSKDVYQMYLYDLLVVLAGIGATLGFTAYFHA